MRVSQHASLKKFTGAHATPCDALCIVECVLVRRVTLSMDSLTQSFLLLYFFTLLDEEITKLGPNSSACQAPPAFLSQVPVTMTELYSVTALRGRSRR